MIFCARATRGLRRPSPGLMARLGVLVGGRGEKAARSGRSFSPHTLRNNERAWSSLSQAVIS